MGSGEQKKRVMGLYFIQTIQPIYIEHLFCARNFIKIWEYKRMKLTVSAILESAILSGRQTLVKESHK